MHIKTEGTSCNNKMSFMSFIILVEITSVTDDFYIGRVEVNMHTYLSKTLYI